MKRQSRSTVFMAQGAMIAAIYTVLTLLAASLNLAYGQVQFRFSEALTILPMFTTAAIPGLTIGCLLSNIFSGYGAADMVFGTLATFLAAVATRMLRNVRIKDVPWLAPMPPVLFNAAIIGAEIAFFAPEGFLWSGFAASALLVGLGELAVCYLLGLPLAILMERSGLSRFLTEEPLRPLGR